MKRIIASSTVAPTSVTVPWWSVITWYFLSNPFCTSGRFSGTAIWRVTGVSSWYSWPISSNAFPVSIPNRTVISYSCARVSDSSLITFCKAWLTLFSEITWDFCFVVTVPSPARISFACCAGTVNANLVASIFPSRISLATDSAVWFMEAVELSSLSAGVSISSYNG